MTIFDLQEKPSIGPAPLYTKGSVINFLSGVTRIDNLVFKLFCDHIIDSNYPRLGRHEIFEIAESIELPKEELGDIITILKITAILMDNGRLTELYGI